MKLHVFSDLQDGFPGSWRPELANGADAVLCAGDVCNGLVEAIRFLRAWIPAPTPIITVAGNHSFYGRAMDTEWEASLAMSETARPNGKPRWQSARGYLGRTQSRDTALVDLRQAKRVADSTCAGTVADSSNIDQPGENDAPSTPLAAAP